MAVKDWFSAQSGSPVVNFVMNMHGWGSYREAHQFFFVDSDNVDLASGAWDFSLWDQETTGFHMDIVDVAGGTLITSLRGNTNIKVQNETNGELLFITTPTTTGAIQTYFEGLTPPVTQFATAVGHLTGVPPDEVRQAIGTAHINFYFGKEVT